MIRAGLMAGNRTKQAGVRAGVMTSVMAGIIGWPVGHSLSPTLHRYWLRENRIAGDYVLLETRPEDLKDAIRALPQRDFAGVNVTIPHKQAAARIVGRIDDDARRIGAVNALTVEEDGSLTGRNTDVFGFLENLKAAVTGWEAARAPAVVLGAGGAARAVVVALLGAGTPELRLVNRTRERAEALAKDIDPRIRIVPWKDRARALAEAGLLVNATPLGMEGGPPLDLALDALPETAAVNDIVYRPLETPLLKRAGARGHPVADGLGMLIHQARPCFTDWFGGRAEDSIALRAALTKKMAKSGR